MTNSTYAGFWIRCCAYTMDKIIISLLVDMLLSPVLVFLELDSDLVILILVLLMVFVFNVFCWVQFAGTPGKLIFKLKVVDMATGQKITLKQAVIRCLSYIPSTIILFCGFFWIAFDEKKQGWHDKLAKTVVIRDKSLF